LNRKIAHRYGLAIGPGETLTHLVQGDSNVHTTVHDVTLLAAPGSSCLSKATSWLCWPYIHARFGEIQHALYQHIELSALALGIAVIVAAFLCLLASVLPWSKTVILAVLGLIYTIPSIALFVLLQPSFSISSNWPVIIALIGYAQLLLVRNVLVGLEEVPEESLEAARGLGYSKLQLVLRVQLPLALPAIMAGLRITTVSTIALLTVGGVIEKGGLGQLMFDAFQSERNSMLLVAVVLIVALALVADLLLLLLQRLITPWERVRS
jgi:osmoprotectant transport system permease protein